MNEREISRREIDAIPSRAIQKETYEENYKLQDGKYAELKNLVIGPGKYGLIDVELDFSIIAKDRPYEIVSLRLGTAAETRPKPLIVYAYIPIGNLIGNEVIPDELSFSYEIHGGEEPLKKIRKAKVDKTKKEVNFEIIVKFE